MSKSSSPIDLGLGMGTTKQAAPGAVGEGSGQLTDSIAQTEPLAIRLVDAGWGISSKA